MSDTLKKYGNFADYDKLLTALKADKDITDDKRKSLISQAASVEYGAEDTTDLDAQQARQLKLFDAIQADKERLKGKESEETRRNIFAGTIGNVMAGPFQN
jgi:hypothetical protein